MKTDDQKFEGPGFETFRSNFSLISQKCDKRHTRCAFTKLLKLIYQLSKKQFEDYADFLVRAFKADHNVLTELPYDFSQLLQNFDTKNVTLGYNQWMCSCHAEITSVVRRFLYSSCPMSIQILNYAEGISVLLLPAH